MTVRTESQYREFLKGRLRLVHKSLVESINIFKKRRPKDPLYLVMVKQSRKFATDDYPSDHIYLAARELVLDMVPAEYSKIYGRSLADFDGNWTTDCDQIVALLQAGITNCTRRIEVM